MPQTSAILTLPQLSPEVADAHNALGRNFAPYPLAVGQARMLAGISGADVAPGNDPWLHLTLDGSAAALQLPEPLMAKLIGAPVDIRAGSDLALLLEDALADWLDTAEAAGLPTVRFQAVAPAPPSLPVVRSLALRGQSEAGQFVQFRAALLLSAGAARRLARQMQSRIEPRKLPAGLPLRAKILLDGPKLTSGQLSALRPGDGIRLPLGAEAGLPSPYTLHIASVLATLTPEAGGYRLATPLRFPPKGGASMTQPADTTTGTTNTTTAPAASPSETAPGASPMSAPGTGAETAAPATPDMDALPIQLSFQVGEAALSLGELGTLGPGALIPVAGGPDMALEILANGQRIGTGEVVAIGEARAVRVIALD